MKKYRGKKILIIGAARQGLALARYLAGIGAQVTLSDMRSEAQLQDEISSLSQLPIQWVLGGHPLSLLGNTDIIALSGGVPLTIPIVVEAIKNGIPLTNDSQIFFEACPSRIIGITGSAGKTTTTALLGDIARKHVEIKNSSQKVWVGGNIGNPLIEHVAEIAAEDIVVLELSSFQLELMTHSPQVAAVLNITPNHLDRHGTMELYTDAKSRILAFQNHADFAILNRDDPGSWNLSEHAKAQIISFGKTMPLQSTNGTYVKKDHIYLHMDYQDVKLLPLDWIHLRGEHNLSNILAACALSVAATFALPAIQEAVDDFQGVPHRMEIVRELYGVTWVNDSIATAPERSMAALRAFSEPIVLLAGGRDKNLPWEDFGELARQKVAHLICFGECAGKIIDAIGQIEPGQQPFSVTRCEHLEQAVKLAANLAQAGEVVLLSPGGTSFDEFKDFEQRGERFRQWVNELS